MTVNAEYLVNGLLDQMYKLMPPAVKRESDGIADRKRIRKGDRCGQTPRGQTQMLLNERYEQSSLTQPFNLMPFRRVSGSGARHDETCDQADGHEHKPREKCVPNGSAENRNQSR